MTSITSGEWSSLSQLVCICGVSDTSSRNTILVKSTAPRQSVLREKHSKKIGVGGGSRGYNPLYCADDSVMNDEFSMIDPIEEIGGQSLIHSELLSPRPQGYCIGEKVPSIYRGVKSLLKSEESERIYLHDECQSGVRQLRTDLDVLQSHMKHALNANRICEVSERCHRAQVHDRWATAWNAFVTAEGVARSKLGRLRNRRAGKRSGIVEEVLEVRREDRLKKLCLLMETVGLPSPAGGVGSEPLVRRRGKMKSQLKKPQGLRREARWITDASNALKADLLETTHAGSR